MAATSTRWNTPDRIFHWVMAALVIIMITVGLYIHGLDPDNPAEAPIKSQLGGVHKATGMLILALVTARLGWRLGTGRPALPDTVAAWQRTAAYISHAALYLLMFAMPISGYVMSSYVQKPVNFYGLFEIPPLPVEKSVETAKAVFEIHETMAMILIVLIAVHVAGALKHHFVDRDRVLVRMLTGREQP